MEAAVHLLTFVLAALGFAYLPGPAMLYTVAQTLGRGQRFGWLAALGVHLGCYVHVVAATLGLAALFAAVPPAYVAMKVIGGVYLLWAALRLWREGLPAASDVAASASARRVLRDSMLVEIFNPKTALFFVAFLPQFVQPEAAMPVTWQLLCLGVATNLLFSSADIVVVALAAPLRRWLLAQRGSSRLVQRLGAGLLAALGGHGLLTLSR
ncbi:LysE family translocator [Modicisalibacter tunisiensis]|uniref:LysE family translocator n=1 Tax=Modicisalibacter tunisiensis TaxID=390637 RepID=A0ABS7WVC1_9GAMM|nr:LysE family translocator [Modicisalibacter tunisiensis]MBZ9566563.1 LysE family translocator [Modicisalibacter tunisiensis]